MRFEASNLDRICDCREAMDMIFKRKDPKEFDVKPRMLVTVGLQLRFWPTECLIRKLK